MSYTMGVFFMSAAKQSSKNLILTILNILSRLNTFSSVRSPFSKKQFFAKSIQSTRSTQLTQSTSSLFSQFKPHLYLNFSFSFFYSFFVYLVLSIFAGLIVFSSPNVFAEDSSKAAMAMQKTIGISQIVEHPALDEVRLGLLEALKEEGFVEGKNLKVNYENAQGNISTSSQIASKLLGEDLNLAVAISTPSAQTLFFAASKQHRRIPIVFSAVSDPEAAKLVSSTYPITGVTDAPNLEGLLELIQKLLPNLKTLGLMYNPAEANSVSTITKLKKMLKERSISIHEVTVNKTSDVAQAMQSLIGKVDALYFPQDNTVVAAIETVANIAQHSSPTLPVILPIFSNDPALIKRGILAAVGFDYKDVGKETGKVVAKILLGANPNAIPIHNSQHLKVVVNQSLVNKLGLTVPTELQNAKVQLID